MDRLADVLDGSLGLNILPDGWGFTKVIGTEQTLATAIRAATIIVILYLSVFCLSLYFLNYACGRSVVNTDLARLQIYGALWAGWATVSTRVTSASVFAILAGKVIPALSDTAVSRVSDELSHSFRRPAIREMSWILGTLSGVAAGILICTDVKPAKVSLPELMWWSLGWTILFTTSANVVNTSRVYVPFAAAVAAEPRRLDPLDPARSAIISDINAVAKRMLLFWLGISVSIACIIPFAIRKSWPKIETESIAAFATSFFKDAFVLEVGRNNFVLVDLLMTSVFSIGVGTVLFLRHEALVREGVRDARAASLAKLSRLIDEQLQRLGELDESDRKRLKDLNDLRGSVVAAGSYRSVLISGLSLILPFVPLISLLVGKYLK